MKFKIFIVPDLGTLCILMIIDTMNKSIGSEKYSRLIRWLKEARVSKGVSMRALGTILNEPHSFVQKTEILERKLDVYEYMQYCEALELNPEKGLEFLK